MPDPSPSNADSLKLQLLTARKKGVVAGHSGQFTPGGYLSTVIHTSLAGIEPTTFRIRLLFRRATIRATETTRLLLSNHFIATVHPWGPDFVQADDATIACDSNGDRGRP